MSDNQKPDNQTPVRGVIDRVVENIAVVLLEAVGEELHVPATDLPDEADEGSVLILTLDSDGQVVSVEVHNELAQQRRDEMKDRLERLRTERSTGRFNPP